MKFHGMKKIHGGMTMSGIRMNMIGHGGVEQVGWNEGFYDNDLTWH